MGNRKSYFNGRSVFIGFSLSSIFRVTNNNFWISEIIGMLLGFLTIFLVKKTNNYKITKKICGFIFVLISILLLVYMSSTLYLGETPDMILAIYALIGVFIMSKCKESSLTRTYSILFVFSLAMFIASQGLLFMEAKIDNLLPLFNSGLKDTLYGALIFYLASIVPVLALNDVSSKEDRKDLLINYTMSTLSIILISLTTVMVLGMNEAQIYRYPEYGVLKRIQIYEFFSNVDNAFTIIMVIDLLVTAVSGLKYMELKGKLSNIVVFLILLFSISWLSAHAGVMVKVYDLLPALLAILLVLTILPKKSANKTSE